MDANDAGDLNELERRLSSWQPAAEGLSTDAMLFAAGRAAAGKSAARFVWPALACLMTLAAIVLGIRLSSERTERQMLAKRLHEQSPAPTRPPSPSSESVPLPAPAAEELSPDSFLASHRALEHGLDSWPPRALVLAHPPLPPSANSVVLRVGQRDSLLDP